jgi:hypothetical protein
VPPSRPVNPVGETGVEQRTPGLKKLPYSVVSERKRPQTNNKHTSNRTDNNFPETSIPSRTSMTVPAVHTQRLVLASSREPSGSFSRLARCIRIAMLPSSMGFSLL